MNMLGYDSRHEPFTYQAWQHFTSTRTQQDLCDFWLDLIFLSLCFKINWNVSLKLATWTGRLGSKSSQWSKHQLVPRMEHQGNLLAGQKEWPALKKAIINTRNTRKDKGRLKIPRVSIINSFHIMKNFALIIILLNFLIYEEQTFGNFQLFDFLT